MVVELRLDREAAEIRELVVELKRTGKPIRRLADDGHQVMVDWQEIHRAVGQH